MAGTVARSLSAIPSSESKVAQRWGRWKTASKTELSGKGLLFHVFKGLEL